MSAPRLIVMGVSGCGKSTVGALLGARTGIPFIEGDTLHPPRNVALMAAGTPLTDEDRAGWLDDIASRFAALAPNAGLIVSCSALKRIYRDRLRAACPDLRFIHLHGTKALLDLTLTSRLEQVNAAAIAVYVLCRDKLCTFCKKSDERMHSV